MKTKTTLSLLIIMMTGTLAFAQPSKQTVINYTKSKNAEITKVVCGDPSKKIENGVYKYFFPVTSHIKTEYPGITRVYRYAQVWTSNSYERATVGDNYYLGIPNPPKELFEGYLNDDKLSAFGGNGASLANKACSPSDFKIDEESYLWTNLNHVEFNATIEYLEKVNDLTDVERVRRVMHFGFSRSEDGKTWDPKAKLLTNGTWMVTGDNARRLMGTTEKRETLEEMKYSQEEYDQLKSVAMLYRMEQQKEFLSSLPSVTIPEFKSENHVIQFMHETMLTGDKGKIEATLNEMVPDSWFTDRSSYFYTITGANIVNKIVENAEMYKEYFCQHPQIKHQQEGMIQFYTKTLGSFGRIQVYQSQSGKWRVTAVEYPYGTGSHLEEARAAGDKNCSEALNVDAPEPVKKYAIGESVIGTIRGTQYAGKVEKIDNMMEDRYFVRFEGANAQWITAEDLQPGTSGQTKTDTNTTTNESKGEKTKEKLNGLKSRIKIN